ncbi:ferritin-like domain-containing protein [Mesorhizobium sp. ES1-1]|uniref:ferritin-like domain-containing protein n=1 Tax=Mesorhizobium sp. ES1-1 TaxID=2876629 RepID=UPI001CD03C55|nr:ferritin-like domain-containing protein [Mesorhizobium sp. ES1-1]MBZ9676159.1 ferritin-like domain-containing protein [Mesorhizobium sp. ES1-1]
MNTDFTSETRAIFIDGLRNAHAMENQALSIMKPQVARIENYPEVASRLQQHIRETEGQITRLESILSGFDKEPSTLKDTALSMVGSLATIGHAMAGDEILKNSFANYAFENFEIAAYNSLLVLAQAGGLQEAQQILQQNLSEEEAMAEWLEQNLPVVTLRYAELREAGQTAKS